MSASGVRIVNANRERIYKASLSLSGCGFLSIYHAGVCAAIKEYAPQLLQNRISGASAGSIIAAGVICNVCISHAARFFLSVVSEVSFEVTEVIETTQKIISFSFFFFFFLLK